MTGPAAKPALARGSESRAHWLRMRSAALAALSVSGSVVLRVGQLELGHLHGDAVADVPLVPTLQDQLVKDGVLQLKAASRQLRARER